MYSMVSFFHPCAVILDTLRLYQTLCSSAAVRSLLPGLAGWLLAMIFSNLKKDRRQKAISCGGTGLLLEATYTHKASQSTGRMAPYFPVSSRAFSLRFDILTQAQSLYLLLSFPALLSITNFFGWLWMEIKKVTPLLSHWAHVGILFFYSLLSSAASIIGRVFIKTQKVKKGLLEGIAQSVGCLSQSGHSSITYNATCYERSRRIWS